MKRSRDPLGRVSSTNSNPARTPSGTQGKRSRHQEHQGYVVASDPHQKKSEEALRQELGPFRALLATCGVVWRSAAGARSGDGAEDEGKNLGYPCRGNPSKLRLGVEKALVHDPARRQEFVEVSVSWLWIMEHLPPEM